MSRYTKEFKLEAIRLLKESQIKGSTPIKGEGGEKKERCG